MIYVAVGSASRGSSVDTTRMDTTDSMFRILITKNSPGDSTITLKDRVR